MALPAGIPNELETLIKESREAPSFEKSLTLIRGFRRSKYQGCPDIIMAEIINIFKRNPKILTEKANFDVLEEGFMTALQLELVDWADMMLKIIR